MFSLIFSLSETPINTHKILLSLSLSLSNTHTHEHILPEKHDLTHKHTPSYTQTCSLTLALARTRTQTHKLPHSLQALICLKTSASTSDVFVDTNDHLFVKKRFFLKIFLKQLFSLSYFDSCWRKWSTNCSDWKAKHTEQVLLVLQYCPYLNV